MISLGHCLSVIGMVLYALATSWTTDSVPQDRDAMRALIVEKVPQVQRNWDASIAELINRLGDWYRGYDKFCMMWNLPGCSGLGIIDMGEDWKGPISASNSVDVRGPM